MAVYGIIIGLYGGGWIIRPWETMHDNTTIAGGLHINISYCQ